MESHWPPRIPLSNPRPRTLKDHKVDSMNQPNMKAVTVSLRFRAQGFFGGLGGALRFSLRNSLDYTPVILAEGQDTLWECHVKWTPAWASHVLIIKSCNARPFASKIHIRTHHVVLMKCNHGSELNAKNKVQLRDNRSHRGHFTTENSLPSEACTVTIIDLVHSCAPL